MPTYNYICLACDKEISIFQNMNDTPISDCENCENGKLEKIISGGAGLIFKGSGFYLTDYKNKKNKKNNKSKE